MWKCFAQLFSTYRLLGFVIFGKRISAQKLLVKLTTKERLVGVAPNRGQFHQPKELMPLKKILKKGVDAILFHQQKHLYKHTQLEVMSIFYTLCSSRSVRRISINITAQMLLVECWWKWPQDELNLSPAMRWSLIFYFVLDNSLKIDITKKQRLLRRKVRKEN